jgi:uncharacterized protein
MEEKLLEDLKKAQLKKNEVELLTLRGLLSEIKYAKLQKGVKIEDPFEDDEIISVVQKEAKKRKESIDAFNSANRPELSEKEQQELEVLEKYLPEQLSEEELTKLVEEAIFETGATEVSDMGKVIGVVKARVGQGADGSRISNIAKTRLGK